MLWDTFPVDFVTTVPALNGVRVTCGCLSGAGGLCLQRTPQEVQVVERPKAEAETWMSKKQFSVRGHEGIGSQPVQSPVFVANPSWADWVSQWGTGNLSLRMRHTEHVARHGGRGHPKRWQQQKLPPHNRQTSTLQRAPKGHAAMLPVYTAVVSGSWRQYMQLHMS